MDYSQNVAISLHTAWIWTGLSISSTYIESLKMIKHMKLWPVIHHIPPIVGVAVEWGMRLTSSCPLAFSLFDHRPVRTVASRSSRLLSCTNLVTKYIHTITLQFYKFLLSFGFSRCSEYFYLLLNFDADSIIVSLNKSNLCVKLWHPHHQQTCHLVRG